MLPSTSTPKSQSSLDSHLSELDSAIQKYQKTPNIEMEARFTPKIIDNRLFHTLLGYFEASSEIYSLVLSDITRFTNSQLQTTAPIGPEVINDYSWTPGNVRVTDIYRNGPKLIVQKEKLEAIDIPNFFVRFGFATEKPLGAIQNVPVDATDESVIYGNVPPLSGKIRQAHRVKRRWSFILKIDDKNHPLYNYRIDLTHVTGWFNNERDRKINVNSYEVELEVLDVKKMKNAVQLWRGIEFMLKMIQQTPFPVSHDTLDNVSRDIVRLMRDRGRQFTNINKPTNLKLPTLVESAKNIAITDKADGERRLLYICGDSVYLYFYTSGVTRYLKGVDDENADISPEYADYIIETTKTQKFQKTLLDVEYVKIGNLRHCLVFDVLAFKGRDVRRESFEKRYQLLCDNFENFHSLISVKKFWMPGSLKEKGNDFYARISHMFDVVIPEREKIVGNDGIIMNNIKHDYNGAVYKWKPIELLTIDFMVRRMNEKPDARGTYVYQLYSKGADQKMYLFVGDKMHSYDGIMKTSAVYNSGQIVEFQWEPLLGSFKPLRVRLDRDQPNNMRTALSIWADIQNPITEEVVRGEGLVLMRKHQNMVKHRMLNDNCSSSVLLDIGSGRGGDLHKWKSANVQASKVIAVEPNIDNMAEFRLRLSESNYESIDPDAVVPVYRSTDKGTSTEVHLLNLQGQDSTNIGAYLSEIRRRYVNCVVMFNSLTFFFESEAMLDAIVDTISNSLAPGGQFIGMVMDGKKVRNAFRKTAKIAKKGQKLRYTDKKMWSIVELSKNDTPYGNKVMIDIKDSIVDNQTEYLVDLNTLTAKLQAKGFDAPKLVNLNNANLPLRQEKLNDLYTGFVYKKKRTTSGETAATVATRTIVLEVPERELMYPWAVEDNDDSDIELSDSDTDGTEVNDKNNVETVLKMVQTISKGKEKASPSPVSVKSEDMAIQQLESEFEKLNLDETAVVAAVPIVSAVEAANIASTSTAPPKIVQTSTPTKVDNCIKCVISDNTAGFDPKTEKCVEKQKCAAITLKNTQCKYNARPGMKYCSRHKSQES